MWSDYVYGKSYGGIELKKIIFFISCFFLMVNNVLALTMTCPEIASPGEVIKMHVEGDKYNGIKGKFNLESGFKYQDIILNSPWKSYYEGYDGFVVGNVSNQDKMLMDIELKIDINKEINKDYTIELSEIAASDKEYKNIQLDNLSCKVKLVSDINTLDNIEVDGIKINPKFSKNIYSYKATTKKDKVNIKAVLTDKSSKLEGDMGEQKLNIGVNTFTIKVTSARGNVREYKIYITREVDKKSNDVTLKSLSLSSGKIEFDRNKFLYAVDVNYDIDNIEVEAISNDNKSKVEIEKPNSLVIGENTINIKVIAEDGSAGTYVIVVNRKDKLSEDASIKNLIIKNYNINFSSDIYNYDLLIDGEEKLDIEVILNDNKSKYKILGNNNLKNNSVIKIEVQAENEAILIYKINILKLNKNTSSSIINYIKILPLTIFVILVFVVLIVKLIKKLVNKNSKID